MKTTIYLRCLFILIAGYVSSCSNPIEDIKIMIDADVIKNSAVIRIIDPQSPETIPSNIAISVSGKDSSSIFEISGSKSFKVKDGMISIGVDPARAITESNPAECMINVSAPGYLSVSEPVTFTPSRVQQMISINLIKAINPPAGVSIIQKAINLKDRMLPSALVIETPKNAEKESVKAGFDNATLFTVNDKAVSGKRLVLTLSHFDAHNPSSIQSFPGGLLSTGVTLPDGSTGNINFSTAGFFRLQADLDNQVITSTKTPFTISATIDPSITNPETNKIAQPGDNIGVWRYTPSSGKWVFYKDVTLTSQDGKLKAGFSADFTGWYSLCWYKIACLNTLKVNITSLCKNAGNNYIAAFFNQTDFFPYYTYRLDLNNSAASFSYKNLPQSATMVKIFDYQTFNAWANSPSGNNPPKAVAESQWIEACASAPVSLTIPDNPAPEVTLEFSGYCPANPSLAIRLSLYVFYREAGTSAFRYLGFMDKGKLVTRDLEQGKTYDLKSTYNGEPITVTRTISQLSLSERIQLPESTCKGF